MIIVVSGPSLLDITLRHEIVHWIKRLPSTAYFGLWNMPCGNHIDI